MRFKAIATILLTAALNINTCTAAEIPAAAQQEDTRSYFEECPQLPVPSSCLELQQGFTMRSTINGVASSSYGYTVPYGSDEDIADVGQAYLTILKENGLEIKETSDGAYEVYENEEKIADITIDQQLTISIGNSENSGSGNSFFPFWGSRSTPDETSQPQLLTLGETIDLDFVSFTPDEITAVDELRPDDTSEENFYYLEDKKGEQYLCLKGSIKNTGTQSISSQAVATRLTINDRYSSRYGHFLLSNDPKEIIGDQLQPGEEGTFCLYFEVADDVIFFLEDAEIRFGFNENFQSRYGTADYIYKLPFTMDDISGRML